MGDLLQSTPMIAGLRSKYPEAEISILVQESLRPICTGFPGVDRVLSFDAERYISQLSDPSRGIDHNYVYLKRFIERIGSGYDLIINLSHTSLSAKITGLIGADDIRGTTMLPGGRSIVKHPWMEYFYYVTAQRRYNTFNLVDMYNRTGEAGPVGKKLLYNIPGEMIDVHEELYAGTSGEYIGFQLGASTDSRRWPPEYFGKLAEAVRQKYGWNIVVFGTASEKPYLDEMQKHYSGPVIGCIGKTTMPQLGALLKQCKFLVTNDTGTMHFAAAVGTPVIAVFLAAARSSDTGPYTENALILEANLECAPCEYNTECERHDCRHCVKPENVLFAIDNYHNLTSGPIDQYDDEPQFKEVRLFRPVFEEDGYLTVVPLIKRPLTFEDLLKIAYRRMWKYLLEGSVSDQTADYDLYYLPPEEDRFEEKLDDFCELMERIGSLGKKGLEMEREIKRIAAASFRDENELRFYSTILTLLDGSLWQYEWNYDETRPVTKSVRLFMRNIENHSPDAIFEMTERIYKTLIEGALFVIGHLEQFKKSRALITAGTA